jgi:hypothetical protein
MELVKLKEENEKHLASLRIETNLNLPPIEGQSEVKPKSSQQVASRACAIGYVVGLIYDADREDLIEQLKQYELWEKFVTTTEKKSLEVEQISDEVKNEYSWLPESIQALSWCLGLVELDHFNYCDEDLADNFPLGNDPSSFIENAELRPIEEIQRECDLLYRLHWYTKKCYREGDVSKLDLGVIEARRKAIDWVYGVEENWDEIQLDT